MAKNYCEALDLLPENKNTEDELQALGVLNKTG
jgi:hypothetical protein